ncbi:hypothetical protein JW935_05950 [candidate division KSB1 bacterium]|nr:hypothetical protein [candidate division KSB1 bacterium]
MVKKKSSAEAKAKKTKSPRATGKKEKATGKKATAEKSPRATGKKEKATAETKPAKLKTKTEMTAAMKKRAADRKNKFRRIQNRNRIKRFCGMM